MVDRSDFPDNQLDDGFNSTTASKHLPAQETKVDAFLSTEEPNRNGGETESSPPEAMRSSESQYGAHDVIKLFVPVSACMLIVILSCRNIDYFKLREETSATLIYTPMLEVGSFRSRIVASVVNALIFMGFVVFITIVLIALYKYRCYKVIQGWLILTTTILLFLFMYVYIYQMLYSMNLFTVDMITLAIFVWNVGVVGTICIHWHGPLLLRQIYLVLISAMIALVFYKYLPDWTGWFVLAIICVWDLVAVLSPCGPLRFLVKTAQKRNESIFPSLIYSSGTMYMAAPNEDAEKVEAVEDNPEAVENPDSSNPPDSSDQVRTRQRRTKRRPSRGVKLGLGDFIFYSILICKASQSDWLSIVCTFLAILLGLCLTLVLLAIFRSALPALPISITMGIVAYFATAYVVSPFSDFLAVNQVFV